jgi:hypothetical protein
MLLHAAEGHEGTPPRFPGIELLLAHEALRLHLDVETDLLVNPGFGGAPAEEAQARARRMEPAHDTFRTDSSPAAKRLQLSSSTPRVRRPEAVMW